MQYSLRVLPSGIPLAERCDLRVAGAGGGRLPNSARWARHAPEYRKAFAKGSGDQMRERCTSMGARVISLPMVEHEQRTGGIAISIGDLRFGASADCEARLRLRAWRFCNRHQTRSAGRRPGKLRCRAAETTAAGITGARCGNYGLREDGPHCGNYELDCGRRHEAPRLSATCDQKRRFPPQ